ncbi:MAG TPA: hypothetical protein PK583_05565 [Gammaproteobacteria bacterium]|nr:hypothetical protein [Gammaproteobacteria bacterium]HRA42413.1 hypothetical protein [Gammaproteobacteria bacterium]
MLGYLRKAQLSLFVISLTCPVTMAYANGDFGNDNDKQRTVSNTKKCYSTHVKKHKKHHAKKHSHANGVARKSHVSNKAEDDIENDIENDMGSEDGGKNRNCKESIIKGYCEPFPAIRVDCKTINPADLVDFTCDAFPDKIQSCEAYTCQAPYVLDPTVKTTWQIQGKSGDRCIVSSITEDIGIKDNDGAPVPLTQTCEYDEIGIKGLIRRFNDLEKRYFHFSTCEHFEGIHNCTFKSGGANVPP